MKGVREFYDRTAADWAEKWYGDDSQLPLLKRFMAYLPQKPRILDLCCGAGYESMRLAELGAKVVGLDISPRSIEIARERNPGLEFHVGDMLEDYSHIGTFDGVACIAGLVHIPHEQAGMAFARVSQVLNPGGYLLVVVREGEGRIERQSRQVIDGEEYDRAFFGYTLPALMDAAGDDFEFVEEAADEEPSFWRNYVLRKKQ